MIVWGGIKYLNYFDDGKRYDPGGLGAAWQPMSSVGAPLTLRPQATLRSGRAT